MAAVNIELLQHILAQLASFLTSCKVSFINQSVKFEAIFLGLVFI